MINVTKNKLTKALEYLGEYPKSSLKKDELIELLEDLYSEDKIEHLTNVINYEMYNLLKKLVSANGGIYVSVEKEHEANLLYYILIIAEPTKIDKKMYIRFEDNMKEKIAKLINEKNEKTIKENQKIVDLVINIIGTYGIMQVDYELANMLHNLLHKDIDFDELIELIYYNIDLRRKVFISECDTDLFLMSNEICDPQAIMDERVKRKLDYKEYTIEELKTKNKEALINCEEAKKIIEFLKEREFEEPKRLVMTYIYEIMTSPEINFQNLLNVEGLNIKDIDEANEYLQLIMNLHNNIPHYALYGYSPNDLMKMSIEAMKKEEKQKKKNKIGRNDPCPCGSGKKYKNCCLNKVIQVDFRNEKYPDCIEQEDAKMFFTLRNLLLDYTNQKYNINLELEGFNDINNSLPEEVIEIRDKMWSDKNIIKQYIKENPNNLDKKLLQALEDWNEKKINSKFILYKYEDEYTVLLGEENIYYIKGLKDTIKNIIPEYKVPIFIETVLLPFQDQIIYDSYIIQYNMSFGRGLKDNFDKQYKEFIKQKKVKYQL